MRLIQQALLFVVADKNRWKCDLIATTDSICSVDLEELTDWFSDGIPAPEFQFEASKLFFHPLPSGHLTLGRMVAKPEGIEAGSGCLPNKRSFYVHFLIVSQNTLLHFANNPITLYQRLYGMGNAPLFQRTPHRLKPIQIPESVRPIPYVDETVLTKLINTPGPKATAILLQNVLDSVCTFFSGGPNSLRMLHGLFNLLPLSWRLELTFSTNIPLSRSPSFKLVGIPSGTNPFRLNSNNDHGISFCDLTAIRRTERKTAALLDAWPLFIYHLLQRKDFGLLQQVYQEEARIVPGLVTADCPPGSNPEELRILGNRYLRVLLSSTDSKENTQQPPKSIIKHFDSEDALKMDQANCVSFVFPELKEPDHPDFADREIYRTDYVEERTDFPANPTLPAPLATMIQQKVVKMDDTESSPLLKRIMKYPYLKNDLRWLDSCTARVLLGDSTAQIPFRKCWSEICHQTDFSQQLELKEDYLLLIRDFMNAHSLQTEPRLLERDVNILELLDVLLG